MKLQDTMKINNVMQDLAVLVTPSTGLISVNGNPVRFMCHEVMTRDQLALREQVRKELLAGGDIVEICTHIWDESEIPEYEVSEAYMEINTAEDINKAILAALLDVYGQTHI